MCPSVENPDLVCQETGNSQSSTHPKPAECDSRETVKTRTRLASSRGLPSYMFPVSPASSGPVCHQVQQQTTTVCVTGSRPPGSGCTQSFLGRSGPISLPTNSHLGQTGGLPVQQDHTDCIRVTQHALVLGPSGHVQSDPTVPAQSAQSGDSTIQPNPAQESVKPEPTCLTPRATAIKERGFSEAVAARNEAHQSINQISL